jgi:hypothetical protein
LGSFIATKKDRDRVAGLFVINAIAGAGIDLHFAATLTDRFDVAGISIFKTLDPRQHFGPGFDIP